MDRTKEYASTPCSLQAFGIRCIASTEEQTQGSNFFPSTFVCVVFCFHGDVSDGSSTEAETETEEKGNLPFLSSPLPSSLSLCHPVFTMT